ncbi:hypothetical protein Tco_0296492 [Tanacetum coccineum]
MLFIQYPRIKTCVLKKTRTWMPIEEDVELKRKRTPHRDKLLRRERKADEKRTIRGTTIERETFREDHNIGGSRERFEIPFKVTGLSNYGQSLGSEISANLQMRARRNLPRSRYDDRDDQMMRRKKVLVVLDDVDSTNQLEALAGDPNWQIAIGQRFSLNKSSIVHEKPNTPRSCLRWIPMGRIFKLAGLRWIPTRKLFDSYTSKVYSEPPNGSNDDITNPYECNQTLNVSAGPGPQLMTPGTINSGLVQNIPSPTPAVPPTKIDWDSLFQPMFDEYFKPPPNVDHPVPEVPTPVPAASTSSPSSTTVDQDAPSTSTSQTTSEQQSLVIPQGVEDDFYDIEVAHMDNDPYFGIPFPEPSSEETTLQGIIPSNLHHLNQSFDTLTKLTKKHPLENVIGDPSRSVSTRSQLQEHAIWCYFDANDNPIPFGGKRSG